jgi:hypothetical protein
MNEHAIQVLTDDFRFQAETYFAKNGVNSIFAICHPMSTFVIGVLTNEKTVCTITNLICSDHMTEAEKVVSMFTPNYSYILDDKGINVRDYSAVYICTGNSTLDTCLTQQLLQNITTNQIILTVNTTLQTLYIPPEYMALPIISNTSVLLKCKRHLNIEWLRNVYKPYNFNSSCVAVDKYTAEPSFIETAGTDLLYSVRIATNKFSESDTVFLKNDTILDQQLLCNPTCREDLRFFTWKGELYGSYTFIHPYIAGIPTFQKLAVGKFSLTKSDILLDSEVIPRYGHNLTDISHETGWIRTVEKNWTWWEAPNGKLHCAYMFSPLKILEFDSLESEPKEITVHEDISRLPKGARGGACGVVYDRKVWCFTHASTENSAFNIGVIVLSYDTVPRVMGYCHDVVASEDYWNCIFYTCGAVFSSVEKCWKLTGGVHDTASFVLRISHADLLEKICWI